VIEDMNKMISNFSMFHIYSLTQHHEWLHNAFNPDDAKKNIVVVTENILLEDDA
jgi:hypothetical protein